MKTGKLILFRYLPVLPEPYFLKLCVFPSSLKQTTIGGIFASDFVILYYLVNTGTVTGTNQVAIIKIKEKKKMTSELSADSSNGEKPNYMHDYSGLNHISRETS